MSNLPQFLAYAAAFEKTFADDDWTRLEPFFVDDATYQVSGLPAACTLQGRANIFRGMKKSLDGFDRKMTMREIIPTAPPHEAGDQITFRGKVRYQREGSDPIELFATIDVEYADGKIRRMHDTFTLDPSAMAWLGKNAKDLDGSYL